MPLQGGREGGDGLIEEREGRKEDGWIKGGKTRNKMDALVRRSRQGGLIYRGGREGKKEDGGIEELKREEGCLQCGYGTSKENCVLVEPTPPLASTQANITHATATWPNQMNSFLSYSKLDRMLWYGGATLNRKYI